MGGLLFVVAADPGVFATRSWLDTHDTGFVSRDGEETLIAAAFGGDELSTADRLRAELGPQSVRFGGSDLADEEIGDQVSPRTWLTGSVVLPLKARVMNLLTLSGTFGILVLVFEDGRLERLLAYRSPGGTPGSATVTRLRSASSARGAS